MILAKSLTKSLTGKLLCYLCIAAIALLVLNACTTTDRRMLAQAAKGRNVEQAAESFARQKKHQYQNDPTALVRDVQNLTVLFEQLRGNAGKVWGEKNVNLPSRKKYVKYTDHYRSRALVDFDSGSITVETLNGKAPDSQLKQAIVTTLLTTDDPAETDIFTDTPPNFSGQPYLYGQVLDQEGKAIRYEWRAKRFAEYLIKHHQQRSETSKGTRYSVTFPMVQNHHQLRKQKYSEYVLESSAKYQVPPALIYAIIETESSFNPFAVSPANAYGLMQVVPKTAGKDVYTRIKKRNDQPTRSVLFRPQDNIDIGTAYLHILDDIYLDDLNNHQSREYAVISAYNGGAGNVFKTFSNNRKHAPSVINGLSSSQVYWRLTQKHPRAESRRYLEKVMQYQEKYR
ncbi:membrane-bound lytic murein transglycosylase MltC [Paraneptunicella aestuarii]|uniref:membrane-bound lytic murein transglycosylase MltC n=1 Tax=Paraneptunicella aestuarii TaxID=2831148 RepID=UPI001E39EAC7|nr:membrane-bound lytic murein transglycosylase MltC [Paraneptunicella aestuarii]UAA39166.1 membrane-bound lytic murein transglycosylase MltC [Paraneptunicella aestuarii]